MFLNIYSISFTRHIYYASNNNRYNFISFLCNAIICFDCHHMVFQQKKMFIFMYKQCDDWFNLILIEKVPLSSCRIKMWKKIQRFNQKIYVDDDFCNNNNKKNLQRKIDAHDFILWMETREEITVQQHSSFFVILYSKKYEKEKKNWNELLYS